MDNEELKKLFKDVLKEEFKPLNEKLEKIENRFKKIENKTDIIYDELLELRKM